MHADTELNRRILLASRPNGRPSAENFLLDKRPEHGQHYRIVEQAQQA